MIFERRCWKCQHTFYAIEGTWNCPVCGAITKGVDNITESSPETPQQETICLDRFCKARIPDVEPPGQEKWRDSALGSVPMTAGQLAAQAEAEQGQSFLQRISQLLNDSCALLCNVRLMLLEADRSLLGTQDQQVQSQSGIHNPSNQELEYGSGELRPKTRYVCR